MVPSRLRSTMVLRVCSAASRSSSRSSRMSWLKERSMPPACEARRLETAGGARVGCSCLSIAGSVESSRFQRSSDAMSCTQGHEAGVQSVEALNGWSTRGLAKAPGLQTPETPIHDCWYWDPGRVQSYRGGIVWCFDSIRFAGLVREVIRIESRQCALLARDTVRDGIEALPLVKEGAFVVFVDVAVVVRRAAKRPKSKRVRQMRAMLNGRCCGRQTAAVELQRKREKASRQQEQ